MVCMAHYIRDFLVGAPFTGNYLEIGVFDGEIISEVAKKYPDKKCYGIDPFIEDGWTTGSSNAQKGENITTQRENAFRNCTGLENVHLYEMKSSEFFENLTDEQVNELDVSCIFIDGDHGTEAVQNDVRLAIKLLGKKDGMIICDDWNIPDVSKTALREISEISDRIVEYGRVMNEFKYSPEMSYIVALLFLIKASP